MGRRGHYVIVGELFFLHFTFIWGGDENGKI